MEVHSHSHTPRKNWTHYFWEFLNPAHFEEYANLSTLKQLDWINRIRLMKRILTSARNLILSLKEEYHLE